MGIDEVHEFHVLPRSRGRYDVEEGSTTLMLVVG